MVNTHDDDATIHPRGDGLARSVGGDESPDREIDAPMERLDRTLDDMVAAEAQRSAIDVERFWLRLRERASGARQKSAETARGNAWRAIGRDGATATTLRRIAALAVVAVVLAAGAWWWHRDPEPDGALPREDLALLEEIELLQALEVVTPEDSSEIDWTLLEVVEEVDLEVLEDVSWEILENS